MSAAAGASNMPVIDVLDLPQLYTKPSAESLRQTIALFAIAPPSWERGNKHAGDSPDRVTVNPEGVTRYLTSIVSNSLKWIEDDETKEQIWNEASQRLSERSGRTAMGAITRKFRIPTHFDSFDITIHEPALTGDDLGLKTWAASYMLAKRLHTFDFMQTRASRNLRVLELGSGTGLVGMAMAGLGIDVVLTDMLSIYENLSRNAQDNIETIERNEGTIRTGVLDWTIPTICDLDPTSQDDSQRELLTTKFPVILAADSLYAPEHPQMLVDTIEIWLSPDADVRVVVEFPYRQAYLPQIEDFRNRMERIGLHIEAEGEEQGYDDWGALAAGDDQDEASLVTCWWSCWTRRTPSSH